MDDDFEEWVQCRNEIHRLRAENAKLEIHHGAQKAYLADVTASRDCWLASAKEWSGKLLAAQHRIKELRQALHQGIDDMQGNIIRHGYSATLQKLIETNRRVLATPDNTAEIDALKKDAERYRWLRDDPPLTLAVYSRSGKWPDNLTYIYLDNANLDRAIDAAMKEQT